MTHPARPYREVERADWHREVLAAHADGYTFFDLLTAVDREADGFEVVVHLWAPANRRGLLLGTRCPREDARVASLVEVFAGAAWHERAAAELFGIGFDGHVTTPLLLAESFAGHPLRKDFVLATRVAKSWPGTKEPGESDADLAADLAADLTAGVGSRPRRRRPQPPGTPAGWGRQP